MDLHNQLHRKDPRQLEASEDRGLQTHRLRHRHNIGYGEPGVARLSGLEYYVGQKQGD